MLCRTGNKAKLSFDYYEKNNDEKPTAVSLQRSLDMKNPQIEFTEHSEIILGGVPLQMELPSQFSSSMNYSGCLDGLQVNHHFVGTWNSDVSNNICKPQDKFLVKEINQSINQSLFIHGFKKFIRHEK